jgi:hypothetical protein
MTVRSAIHQINYSSWTIDMRSLKAYHESRKRSIRREKRLIAIGGDG